MTTSMSGLNALCVVLCTCTTEGEYVCFICLTAGNFHSSAATFELESMHANDDFNARRCFAFILHLTKAPGAFTHNALEFIKSKL